MSFSFMGRLPASKSLMNRALIVQSHFPELEVDGKSQCDDVVLMEKNVKGLNFKKAQGAPLLEAEFDCGHAGTVLRFLAPRLAKEKGVFVLKGSRRLFSRPQGPLITVLGQLGSICELKEDRLIIKTDGWHLMGDALHLTSNVSSQFASGVLLSAWSLPFEIYMSLPADLNSKSYLKMTVKLLKQLGMNLTWRENEIYVPPKQQINTHKISIEPDMSSAFAVASVAAISGEAILLGIPEKSLQPDSVFVNILTRMGVGVSTSSQKLTVKKSGELKAVEVDLNDSPDLFPVLASLCCFAHGRSRLYGAAHLKHKESDRIKKTAELLRLAGANIKILDDGMEIQGPTQFSTDTFKFDPDEDHRLAMAAGLLMTGGVRIDLVDPEVVNKSFPEFFQSIGVSV